MDKIEEIARAMSAAVNAGKPPIVEWDKLHREERWLYETAARAAYEVMASSDALRELAETVEAGRGQLPFWLVEQARAALTQSSVQPK